MQSQLKLLKLKTYNLLSQEEEATERMLPPKINSVANITSAREPKEFKIGGFKPPKHPKPSTNNSKLTVLKKLNQDLANLLEDKTQ